MGLFRIQNPATAVYVMAGMIQEVTMHLAVQFGDNAGEGGIGAESVLE
jgi:hypothetical protein